MINAANNGFKIQCIKLNGAIKQPCNYPYVIN